MDDRLITSLLCEVAEQEIPDDMSSLLNRIKERYQARPKRTVRRLSRLGWVAVILTLSLMVSAGVYAFVNSNDEGLIQVQEQNLVIPIGESITIDGVTVTLIWAYADAHRVAVRYNLTLDAPADTAPYAVIPRLPSRLIDDQGHEFSMMFGGGGGGGGGPAADDAGESAGVESTVEPTIVPTINLLAEGSENFDTSIIEGTPESLNLTLEVMVDLQTELASSGEDMAVPGGGGGGGGGEGDGGDYVPEGVGKSVGPFVFEFAVPFIPASTISPDISVVANGVTMTLEEVAITPSMTRATICYEGADPALPWIPTATLSTADQQFSGLPSASLPGEGTGQCSSLRFLVADDGSSFEWTLSVERLEVRGQPNPDELKAAFAEYGVEVTVEPDGQWWATYVPDTIDDFGLVIDEVMLSFAEVIEGPWVFVVEVQ